MGDKLREEMEGYKRDVSFNVHTPLQIVFLQNFENCRLPFKNETLHQLRSIYMYE
jgi:beta-lactamase class D